MHLGMREDQPTHSVEKKLMKCTYIAEIQTTVRMLHKDGLAEMRTGHSGIDDYSIGSVNELRWHVENVCRKLHVRLETMRWRAESQQSLCAFQ